jgi:hypothetical protein
MGQQTPAARDVERESPFGGASRTGRRGDDGIAGAVHIAADRRRDLLRYLAGRSAATVDAAARQIAAWDRKTDPEDVAADHRESVRKDLLRNHLPRLRTCGLVEHDETAGTIALTDSGEAVVTGDSHRG